MKPATAPVLLNCDLGELPGEPEALYDLASVVNIACGGHAGDDASMERALVLAMRAGARVAAHPSYVDRPRFGRVSVDVPVAELRDQVAEQCAALARVAARVGVSVTRMKPHGALYHDASRRRDVAEAVVDGALRGLSQPPMIVGPPSGFLADVAASRSLLYAREGFADRAYGTDGHLVPRAQAGAMLTDPAACAAQATRLATSGDVETICVHGDTTGAIAIARAVRAALDALAAP